VNYAREIKLMASLLAAGETHRGECPECGKRDTFTVTADDEGFVYNCYSANCSLSGGSGTRGRSLVAPEKHLSCNRYSPFLEPLEELNDEQRLQLDERIGFTAEHIALSHVRWCTSQRRYAFPIFSPLWERRGFVLRSYEGRYPKALTHMERDTNLLGWFRQDVRDTRVYVVEDIPSAVRLSFLGRMAVAMCGGSVGPDAVRELAEQAAEVVWAFDEDATRKALDHHKKYRVWFSHSSVQPLERDIKDMTDTEIKELIG
jgi:hypothetical protein